MSLDLGPIDPALSRRPFAGLRRGHRGGLSDALAERAFAASQELFRGLQGEGGALPVGLLSDAPGPVERGLIAAVLKVLVLLYAEESGLVAGRPVAALFERLHAEDARSPADLEQRSGAWASLLDTFRALVEGAPHGPDGRAIEAPPIADAAVLRALGCLMFQGGARIAYGALDVEEIGRVYERITPGDERRRSGSHYTPRELTGPVVSTTLRPVLEALGDAPTPAQILDLKVCDPAMGSGAFLLEVCRALGDALVEAWRRHGSALDGAAGPGADPALLARRLVASRCLYGADKDPLAVDLARLSLWLLARPAAPPRAFLGHALRCGDALIGLDLGRIAAFDWEPGPAIPAIKAVMDRAMVDPEARARTRATGDMIVEAFFAGRTAKARRARRAEALREAQRALTGPAPGGDTAPARDELRRRARPIEPLHWELELPEVFARQNPGFDAIVGNPPFMAGRHISRALSPEHLAWLMAVNQGAGGQADLVAYFFRRAFDLLRDGGALGLIATNTISQGDTRASGLAWICGHGGAIFEATRRLAWPGSAAVLVSVVHLLKNRPAEVARLDGREVPRITAFLAHRGGHADPARLRANAGKSFKGSMIYGPGFTFDDAHPGATPLAAMRRLLAESPRNGERVFPYLGGEEMLGDPAQRHRRYVIGFGAMSEREARAWPDLFAIVEAKVKPSRLRLADNPDGRRRKRAWWQWGRETPGLAQAVRGKRRVLMHAFPSTHLAFAFIPEGTVIGAPHCVFALDDDASFATLSARPHEIWARFFASSLKDDLRYTPSDCFDTFPFPRPGPSALAALDAAGRAYDEHRAALMRARGEGLTATYHRFHDPAERGADIERLRALHAAMDRAVLDAYGFTDVLPEPAFFLHLDEGSRSSRRRALYRYRWPDEVQHEVLSRLIALNRERAGEEAGEEGGTEAGEEGDRLPGNSDVWGYHSA